WNRNPRFFSNRGRRPLRDESFEHLIVMWHSPMPVNGFSFLSEKFLSFIVQQPIGRACMQEFVQKERGTVAPGWAFDLKRDRAVPDEVARSGCLRNFVP